MDNKVVIGAGFGDEGKGRVVSYLASESIRNCRPHPGYPDNTIVVRFNGGHQAGHTVVKDGLRHIFSSFGSGTLHGLPTYWGQRCTVYPKALLNEYDVLKSKGITPTLYINPLCPITTPFDVFHNRAGIHGTCGVGFGSTLQRQEDHYKLYFMDLYYPEIVKEKLKNICDYYKQSHDKSIIGGFLEEVYRLSFLPTIQQKENNFVTNYSIIFEGAQGILLDQDHGFFPYVTRSNTTSKNISYMFNDIYYVIRCYQTRHGKGFMSTEEYKLDLCNNDKETNITNPYQGPFRKGIFDFNLLKYALEIDKLYINKYCHKHLVVTCLDQLNNDRVPLLTIDKQYKTYTKYQFANLLKETFPEYELLISDSEEGDLQKF